MMAKRGREPLFFSLLLGALLIFASLSPFVGITYIDPFRLLDSPDDWEVFVSLRLPRVILAFLCGGALSVTGLIFQSLFRNPLATPFTLGVSSGAALGAVIAIAAAPYLEFIPSAQILISLIGAFLTTATVGALMRGGWGLDGNRLLLCGIMLSSCFSNLILLIQFLADMSGLFEMSRWLIGGVPLLTLHRTAFLGMAIVGTTLLLLTRAREMDLIAIGGEFAQLKGVQVEKTRREMFLLTSVLVACVVSFAGPIGMVGLMEPFVCRQLLAGRHVVLIPFTFLFGGAFLVLCDTTARTVMAPMELPVGIVTGLLGSLFFLYLLKR